MKIIILSLLIAICPLASAEWVNAGSSEDGAFGVYIDSNSIRKSGPIIRVSWIKNYLSVQSSRKGKKYKSVLIVSVYDCKAESSKLSSIAFHSESMAAGEAVISAVFEEEDPLLPILSSSEDTVVWQFVCKNTNKEGIVTSTRIDRWYCNISAAQTANVSPMSRVLSSTKGTVGNYCGGRLKDLTYIPSAGSQHATHH